MTYASAADLSRDLRELIRPPRRVPPSRAAADYIRVESAGGSVPWSAEITPYMVEPLDCVASLSYESVIFVGPARTGKTQALVNGAIAHSVMCDPVGDILAVFPTEKNAHKYGLTDLRKLHQLSPALNEKLSPRAHDTAITRTIYRNGLAVFLGYPASGELAQTTYRRVILSDYDSMPASVGDEGEPFALAAKRVETFLSAGIVAAESSPKRLQSDPRWKPESPHEFPPVDGGIGMLYNRGDRRRWYWTCLHCGDQFLAPALPDYDDLPDIAAAAASARVICPHCGSVHTPTDKRRLQTERARWLTEYEFMRAGGELSVRGDSNRIASFWLLGCAAGFQTWGGLVSKELRAIREFEKSGHEEALKSTRNVDQGLPYLPRAMRSSRSSSDLMERAERETFDRGMVPPGGRFVLSTVDVQASPPRFEVQVTAHGVGRECWIIDRYAIHLSVARKNAKNEPEPINPATYAEDWRVLVDRVLASVYRDEQGREYPVRAIAVDSGGKSGVTAKAYEFWRWCRKNGHGRRVALIKGDGNASDSKPRVTVSFPDSARKDRSAGGRGEVPVYLLNSLLLGDDLDGDLNRTEPGPRYIHYAKWLGEDVIEQLASMVRTPKKWERVYHGAANETWILLVYASALLIKLGVEKWGEHWENAPDWAQPRADVPEKPKVPAGPVRRVAQSPYLGRRR
jgi:phage terminase large subunit GpA-like protein